MRVLVDANVLFPKTTRDWLSLLYGNGGNRMLHVFWTEDILTEVLYRLRRKHPSMDGGSLRDVHDKIVATFEVGRVEDYNPATFVPDLADQNDAHVKAAAVACQADILLTCDKGFTNSTDDLFEVYHPDDFFLLVADSNPSLVEQVVRLQVNYWRGKSGEADLPRALRNADCPQFAERVREILQAMPTQLL